MQTRVGKAVARMRNHELAFEPLKPWVAKQTNGKSLVSGLAAAIWNAMERPGVAPTTKPKAADGAETFHFSLTTVTKSSPFTRLITGEREGSAAAHGSYIERDDAPEDYEKEAARRQEADGIGLKSRLSEELDIALGGQAYIERAGATEPGKSSYALSMYGNLPEVFAARLRFWQEVEDSEVAPKHHFLTVDPRINPDHWAKTAADPSAPKEIAEAAALPFRKIDNKYVATNEPVLLPGVLKIPEALAFEIREYLEANLPSSGPQPATITPGRGGHIQSRLIISLPYELSADDRLLLLKQFCDAMFRNLETENRGKNRRVDVPFWAVVHRPEATSDERNYHAHIVFSERPAKLIFHPETGEPIWDFAYTETKKDKFRITRTRRPLEQAKVRILHDRSWPRTARHTYASLANEMLRARGIDKKLDPRTYEAMGIDHEPVQRLKPNDYAKEKKGVETARSDKSIAAQWDRILANLNQRFNTKTLRPAPWMERRFDSEIRRWKQHNHPISEVLKSARMRWRIASYNAKMLEAEAAAAAVVVEKIRSKLDAPGKSWVPKYPVIGKFVDDVTEKFVTKVRQQAAMHQVTKKTMESYLSEVATLQGPQIGNPISQMIHQLVPSIHPHKIRMFDNFLQISTQIVQAIEAGDDVDISAMHKQARADREAAQKAAGIDEPTPVKPDPTIRRTVEPPAPAQPLPTTTRTSPLMPAGRVVVDGELVLFEVRRKKLEAEQRIAAAKWRAEQIAPQKDTVPRVTTSRLIDDRPTEPAPLPVTKRGPKVAIVAAQPPAPNVAPPPRKFFRNAPAASTPSAAPAPASRSKGTAPQPAPAPVAAPPTSAKTPTASPTLTPAPSAATTSSAAPTITDHTGQASNRIEASVSPPFTRDNPLPAESPQKATGAIEPDAKASAPSPPAEPSPDPKAIEHRKKRRRAVFKNLDRGIGR